MDCLHQNIFTKKVTDIAFTSDFSIIIIVPASPASLCLQSPRPRPTRPRVPYLMSSSPSSCIPKSPHTRPHVQIPLSRPTFIHSPKMAFMGQETLRKHTLIAVYVHFNCFINLTINSHTNPYNLASSRLLWSGFPVVSGEVYSFNWRRRLRLMSKTCPLNLIRTSQ